VRYLNYRIGVPVVAVLCLFLAMAWTKRSDPFQRIEITLNTPQYGKTKAMAVLPKPDGRFPVVIYVHGWTGNLMTDGKPLRQIAELGLAAVGIEYDQTNSAAFDEQFLALQNFIQRQPWAQSNAVAWVGMSLGAQRTLRFILHHPEVQPQLLVRLSGGWDEELEAEAGNIEHPTSNIQHPMSGTLTRRDATLSPVGGEGPNKGAIQVEPGSAVVSTASSDQLKTRRRDDDAPRIHCPVLLVHSDNDQVFPLEDSRRLAALLETNGISVSLRVLPGVGHDFGPDRAVVFRETAEYCRAHLPLADYTAMLRDCRLNEAERQRFNLAMQRAGQNRRELWKAVVSAREPERRTLMMVIGGLEDYDLAHVKASYLKRNVHLAWQARRTYPWCRNTPLDIFEKYVAGPRFYQEQIESWRSALNRLARHEVKYCRTTQEASDKVWKLMNEKVAFNMQESDGILDPLKILDAGSAGCLGLCILHAAMARSVGLPERVTRVLWQNSLGEHFCVEVWSAEDQRWHEIDVSAGNRAFDNDWVMRVPKTAILAPTGDRGLWDGLTVGRWSSFTNTIGHIYPSGDVLIKVLDHGIPAPDRTVAIKLPTVKGLVYMTLARTDLNGEARLTLGRSAQYPYLFFVLPPEEASASARYPFPFSRHQFGEETWQWVQVESGKTQEVVLDLKDRRPFDPNLIPPALSKPL
jgi:dienelactone hydrolase